MATRCKVQVRRLLMTVVALGGLAACAISERSLFEADENGNPIGGDGDGDGDGTGGTSGDGDAAGGTPGDGDGTGGVPGDGDGTGGTMPGDGDGDGTGGTAPTEVECTGTGFTVTGNYADNGTLCGYAWTGFFEDGEICQAGDGSNCLMGELCASGSLPPSDHVGSIYHGAMIGWNVQQVAGLDDVWIAEGSGVTPYFQKGGATGEARLVLQEPDPEAPDDPEKSIDYCAPNLVSGVPLSWSDFSVECYGGGAQAPVFEEGRPLRSVTLQILSNDGIQSFDGLCLDNLVVNP